jgi:hypothetical protein
MIPEELAWLHFWTAEITLQMKFRPFFPKPSIHGLRSRKYLLPGATGTVARISVELV